MLKIGSHVSIAGGLLVAVKEEIIFLRGDL